VDLFRGYSPDQLALIDQLRQAARRKAALDQAAEASTESERRLQALGFWRRLCVNTFTRWWSTVASLLFVLSKRSLGLRGAAISAARKVLQPPALYPELYAADRPIAPVDDEVRKAAALRAIAEGIEMLTTTKGGNLSVENTLQVEELARRVEQGADETHVHDAMRLIAEGESLVETLKRGL
jgi:hypothetical protein